MADADETWTPDFKPGWPDVLPEKLMLLRMMITASPGPVDESADDAEDAEELAFVIHGSTSDTSPKFALVADLTAKDQYGFAGVSVLMPLRQREEPEEGLTPEETNALLARYGEWAAPMLYDFAATQLRSALAGSALWFDVPFDVPRPQLHMWGQDPDAPESGIHSEA